MWYIIYLAITGTIYLGTYVYVVLWAIVYITFLFQYITYMNGSYLWFIFEHSNRCSFWISRIEGDVYCDVWAGRGEAFPVWQLFKACECVSLIIWYYVISCCGILHILPTEMTVSSCRFQTVDAYLSTYLGLREHVCKGHIDIIQYNMQNTCYICSTRHKW